MVDKRHQSNLRSDLVMEKIVASAAQLFAQRGYRATTLQDIATQLGMSKAALYHYIQSKEDLLQPVYIDVLQEAVAELQTIVASSALPSEKLALAIRQHMERIATKPAMIALSLQTNDDLPENSRRIIDEYRHTSTNLFRDIIAEGVACGEMHTSEPKVAALGILGMLNWTQRWFHSEGRLDYRQIAEVFIHLLLRGLLESREEDPLLSASLSDHVSAIRQHTDALASLLQTQGAKRTLQSKK
jgi:TetR/AcrR family transcriptional regulator, cholesterol catabolism regulator